MKIIKIVGIIGAGTMGSALAQKFAQEGFKVVLVDREMKFVEKGLNGIKETLNEGVIKKIFTEEKAQSILSNIFSSERLNDLKNCDLIIEAIFEDFEAKTGLFRDLDKIIGSETIIATNTSSFSVTELADYVSHPERFIGLHYFYHASKNRLVEIIPGEKTSGETYKTVQNFSILSGKDSITCKDSYGFVVNRFFVPWLNEAVRLLEENVGTTSQIDEVCMKVFSIGMGPFALMNVTGIQIAYHAEKTLERIGTTYKVTDLLKRQAELNQLWEISETNGSISIETENIIRKRMLGMVFFISSQLIDEGVCSATEINRGARIGLKWRRGPIELMQKSGEEEVRNLVKQICELYGEKMPVSIGIEYWEMEFVSLNKYGKNAVVTITRPEDMNALNETVFAQLSEKFELADSDENVETIFISGTGKAFVAGADIKFFLDNIRANTIGNIVKFTKFGQEVYDKIDKSSKRVVAVLNGLTLGGGLELALCADIILAVPKAVVAFPETGIGIYPGLGGTQRTQWKIGKGLTKYLVYTGDMLSAAEAVKIGLVDVIIQPEEIFELIEGRKALQELSKNTIEEKYKSIESFFEDNSLQKILSGNNKSERVSQEILEKIIKKIKQKAPIALQTAEKLINEAKGCESELNELTNIFSTQDALLGLSSIGKKVEYQGK